MNSDQPNISATEKSGQAADQRDSRELLAEFVNGNDNAATEIFNRYVLRLLTIAQNRLSPQLQSRLDSDDIVQSAYRSFFRHARDDQITLKRSGDLWRMLAAFTLNKTRSYIEKELAEKRDPRREHPDSFWDCAIQREPSPEEAAIFIEEVASFMRKLSPRDRRVMELRLKGHSVEEIASILANPPPDSNLKVEQVSQATIRRIFRESKHQLEQKTSEN